MSLNFDQFGLSLSMYLMQDQKQDEVCTHSPSMDEVISFVSVLLFKNPIASACIITSACQNEYNSTSKMFYRTYWSLTEVPTDIPAEALYVYLWKNAITSLSTAGFKKLTQCMELDLHQNKISAVQEAAFSGMVSLQTLTLMNNKLAALDHGMFVGLYNLKQQYLSFNRIVKTKEAVFKHLSSLTVIDLSHNRLTTLAPGTFHDIFFVTEVRLHANRLTTLSPELLINQPRPLRLLLSTPSSGNMWWNCASRCWLKHEEQHGNVKLQFTFGDYRPRCRHATRYPDGKGWSFIKCGDPGKSDRYGGNWSSLQCGDPR